MTRISVAESITGEHYDERDVTRFREDDAYAKCFIRSFVEKEDCLKKPIEQVDTVFKFRKEKEINGNTIIQSL